MTRPSEASSYLKAITSIRPRVGLILGSGWGGVAKNVTQSIQIPFSRVPGFQTTHAKGHQGKLIFGFLESVPVLVMAGRFHRYEGYTVKEVTFPIHVMKQLGISAIVITNAAGGVSPKLSVGDIVVVNDHINWLGRAPSGKQNQGTEDELPQTVKGMLGVHSKQFCNQVLSTARANQIPAQTGTYLATLGPTYETRSEYRMMRRLGADVVGMSSIPEAVTAKQIGIDPLVLSLVTNVARPDHQKITSHEEVLEVGRQTEVRAEVIIRGFLRKLHNEAE